MLSLLVHTFNRYDFLWKGCLESWSKFPQKVPMYFGTDTDGHGKHDFGQFKVIYSSEGEWSDRLTSLLNKIETKYVLYLQEDHWPFDKLPDLDEMMDIVLTNDLYRLHLAKRHKYYKLLKEDITYFSSDSKYLVSHQPSIWDKEFLLKCVAYGETPWINEYEGTKRLNLDPNIERKIALYHCNWFSHRCNRGKII